jgi:alkylhydroperoxidase family enzyme
VAVPLDYEVQRLPPHADPSVPALAPAPHAVTSRPAIDLATRAATRDALEAWRAYVFDRDSSLPRAEIAAAVAAWLGDGTTTVPDFDRDVRALAETVTLAPWQLVDASFATLRARGFDDAALFEVCVVASTAGVASRIRVALASL